MECTTQGGAMRFFRHAFGSAATVTFRSQGCITLSNDRLTESGHVSDGTRARVRLSARLPVRAG